MNPDLIMRNYNTPLGILRLNFNTVFALKLRLFPQQHIFFLFSTKKDGFFLKKKILLHQFLQKSCISLHSQVLELNVINF